MTVTKNEFGQVNMWAKEPSMYMTKEDLERALAVGKLLLSGGRLFSICKYETHPLFRTRSRCGQEVYAKNH